MYAVNGRDPSVGLQDFIIRPFLAALKFRKYHLLKTLIPHRWRLRRGGGRGFSKRGSAHELFNIFLVQLQLPIENHTHGNADLVALILDPSVHELANKPFQALAHEIHESLKWFYREVGRP